MGCSKNVKTEIFYINSFKKDCVGVGPMSCLQIKTTEDDSWKSKFLASEFATSRKDIEL